jgi:hypothetical protein
VAGDTDTTIGAGAVAVTITGLLFEAVPSPIVATTENVPADDAVPDAVSFVADTNVVGSGVPANDTTAPAAKPVPLTVSVNAPTGNDDGLTELIEGNGSTVTAAVPLAVGVLRLAARMLTGFTLGTDDGAR